MQSGRFTRITKIEALKCYNTKYVPISTKQK